MVTVGFERTNYTVLESETAANVCVVSTGEIAKMFVVMIFTPDTSSGKQSLLHAVFGIQYVYNIKYSSFTRL